MTPRSHVQIEWQTADWPCLCKWTFLGHIVALRWRKFRSNELLNFFQTYRMMTHVFCSGWDGWSGVVRNSHRSAMALSPIPSIMVNGAAAAAGGVTVSSSGVRTRT